MKHVFARTMVIILIAVLLPGCGRREAFSAEEAAVQFGMEGWDEGALITQESFAVRQVREVDADTKAVFFTFNRRTFERPELCMMLYYADRSPTGFWSLGNGGGACTGPIDGVDEEVLAFDSSWSMMNDSEVPAISTFYAYGLVHDEKITRVRLTWDDGAVSEADLINSSYLVVRDGKSVITQVEGLTAEGTVVHAEEAFVP